MKWLFYVIVLFTISACASGGVVIPPEYLTDEMGKTTRNFNGAVADASTAKEMAKYKAWSNYYKQYEKAYETSGFTMSYQAVKLKDGSTTYLPLVGFKAEPKFIPPPEVSEHPVWKTAGKILDSATRWGFGYLAVDSIVGGYKALNDNAGNHYAGPVQMSGSYNAHSGTGDQTIETGRQQQDQSSRTDSQGCTNGDCGSEGIDTGTDMCNGERGSVPAYPDSEGLLWVTPGVCSCDSWQSSHCN